MAKVPFKLPEAKEALSDAIGVALAEGLNERVPHERDWLVATYHLQGVRNFIIKQNGMVIRPEFNRATMNRYEFQGDLVLAKMQIEKGRLMRADIRPATQKRGMGLSALRDKSIAQVALDYATQNLPLARIYSTFLDMFLTFGTAGLACWLQEDVSLDYLPIIEAIPPKEIIPVPAVPDGPEQVRTLIRDRWVPLEWAKGQELKLGENDDVLEVIEFRPGMGPAQLPVAQSTVLAQSGETTGRAGTIPYVRMQELWQFDARDVVARYVVRVGRRIARDARLADNKVDDQILPLHVARYGSPRGTFYGRGFATRLIPLAKEIEKMQANIFDNVAHLDWHGPLFVPMGMGVKREHFSFGPKPQIIWYEPDHMVPGKDQVFNIQPVNMGDYSGRVVGMAKHHLDELAGQSEIFTGGAPGRVDSAAALGRLYEMGSIPQVPPMAAIADCWQGVYRSMLAAMRPRWKDKAIEAFAIDDAAMGVVIDPETGKVRLDENRLPTPFVVDIDIRDRLPSSPEQRKQELKEALQLELIDDVDYRIHVWREKLELPVGHPAQEATFAKAMFHNLILFGDGQTPGNLVRNKLTGDREFMLRVTDAFMAKMEFSLASADVRQAFEEYKLALMDQEVFPKQLTYPEDLAAEEMAAQQAEATAGVASMPPEAMVAEAAQGVGVGG